MTEQLTVSKGAKTNLAWTLDYFYQGNCQGCLNGSYAHEIIMLHGSLMHVAYNNVDL